MTAERLGDDDELGALLALVLETEANAIQVGDAWDAIASRLLHPDRPGVGSDAVSAAGRRRRVLGGGHCRPCCRRSTRGGRGPRREPHVRDRYWPPRR